METYYRYTRKSWNVWCISLWVVCSLAIGNISHLQAQATKTWDGDTDFELNTAANWDADTLPTFIPSPGDDWKFNSTGVGTLTHSASGAVYINSIEFQAGTYSYTLQGNINNNWILVNGITDNTTSSTQTFSGGGLQSIFLPSGNHTISVTNSSSEIIMSGELKDLAATPNIIKSGNGTLTYTEANAYTGTTSVNGGILKLSTNGTLGSTAASTTVSSGATLQIDSITTVDEDISITGTGVGSGGVDGALYKSNGSTTNVTGDITLAGASTIDIDSGTLRFSGDITGANTLTLTGAGTVELNANTTYTGATIIDGGNVTLSNSGGLGTTAAGTTVQSSGKLTIGSGISVSGEDLTLNQGTLATLGNNTFTGALSLGNAGTNTIDYDGTGSTTMTMSGNFSGTGGVTYDYSGGTTNPGTIVLQGASTYQGATVVNDGTIRVENQDALGDSGGSTTTTFNGNANLVLNNATAMTIDNENIVLSDGVAAGSTLQVMDGSHTVGNQVVLNGNTTISVDNSDDTLTLTNGIDGTGDELTKTGSGSLLMGGTNTFNGVTYGGGGTLGGAMTIGAGGLEINGDSISVAAGDSTSGDTTGLITSSGGASTNVWNATTSGTLIWEISGGMSEGADANSDGTSDASGTFGDDWDALQFTAGNLDLSVFTSGLKLNLNLTSVGSSTGWEWGKKVEIPIIKTTGGIDWNGATFSENYFNIDATGFTDGDTWWIDWGVEYHDNILWITYYATPEPSTYIYSGFILGMLGFVGFRKYRKKKRINAI